MRVTPWIEDLLGDFSESSTLLAEVNNDTDTTALSATDTLFNGEGEVGLACTNVGSKDIRSIACQTEICQPGADHVRKTYIRHVHEV